MGSRARIATVTALAVGLTALMPAGAAAWAPARSAPIHPGVATFTHGAQCTSNFVFVHGSRVYLGQAAHCATATDDMDTNGCRASALPLGTRVRIDGASRRGRLAYSSWLAMRAAGEGNAETCGYNDFALVRVAAADVAKVNPSVPGFGGPTGVGGAGPGDAVYSYGNSGLRGGLDLLSPKQGIVVAIEGGGWSRSVLTVTPGIFGDSGSGVMNGAGRAIGVLATIRYLPLPASNGVGDLSRELAYMHAHSSLDVELARGTQPFRPTLLGAILGA